MKRGLSILLVILGIAALAVAEKVPAGRIELELWLSLRGPLFDAFSAEAMRFNEAQNIYWVTPIWKGTYPEVLSALIAAVRAGEQPHMVQIFEAGTATMMFGLKDFVYPVQNLMAEHGVPFEPEAFIPAVVGYYSLPDGRLGALPYNSSTAVLWYNKDAFRKAGLDPEKPPRTWYEVREAAKAIKEAGAAEIPLSAAWPTWTLFEQMAAIHNVPFATKANGFEGLDTELLLDSDFFLKHLNFLLDMAKEGLFVYGGRDAQADGLFPAGKAAMLLASSGLRARIEKEANFDYGVTYLPYYDDVVEKPYNSIIGGAALWALKSRRFTDEEYLGMALYFAFLSRAENVSKRHIETGYMPITSVAYLLTKAKGYYAEKPAAELPVLQLMRTPTTEYSRGLRLGNFPAIRVVMYEELEAALAGKQGAEEALDKMVKRGNEILREFEALYGG